jgi:hypothetical protein
LVEWWWSWLLAVPRLFFVWQIGNGRRWAWLGAGSVDALWIVYAIHTGQYGFIVTALAFGCLSFRNWCKWRARDAPEVSDRAAPIA